MSVKSGRIALIIAAVFVVIGVITLPGVFKYWWRAGGGHAFGEMSMAEDLRWDSMDKAARAPYITRADAEGLKCALLMVAGEHIPLFFFILITIGLLTRSVSGTFRRLLRLSFFCVWFLGMLFLSLGIGYWGEAIAFPKSLGPAFILYLLVVMFFGVIIGFIKLWRRTRKKEKDA